MISVILYGRNDTYGYNLHKRAALSLNCTAEVLTDPADEIIFVDYNTPDDLPTFAEAIHDTLTPRARRLLRILRVRPRHHQRVASRTHLAALEPIARNVGLRRSAPNRWILSTNTDMIFVPRRGRSLSEVASGLEDGYYHLPRFEIPESSWESLDRFDAPGTIRQVERWASAFHLNEIVRSDDPEIRFDGPGDFQLMLRSDLFKVHGFDENMLLGWHVDANIARRLYLLYGWGGDILDDYFGYHCEHTRQVTPMHRPDSAQNSRDSFFRGVTIPFLPSQEATWGLADDIIEEYRPDSTSNAYLKAIAAAIPEPQEAPTEVLYAQSTFGRNSYAAPHVLPFVLDVLASYPRSTRIGWFGAGPELLLSFAVAWFEMGCLSPILVADTSPWLTAAPPRACVAATAADIAEQADVFVFDWRLPTAAAADPDWQFLDDPAIRQVISGFRMMVAAEERRFSDPGFAPRRFIGINAVNSPCEALLQSYIAAPRSPISGRLRQGFLINPRAVREMLPLLHVGDAGGRAMAEIRSRPGCEGHICYGPYLDLPPGQYRVELTYLLDEEARSAIASAPRVSMEVVSGPYLLWFHALGIRDLSAGRTSFVFEIGQELLDFSPIIGVEFRLRTDGRAGFALTGASVARVAEDQGEAALGCDWLPMLHVGTAGTIEPPATEHSGNLDQNEPPWPGSPVHARRGVAAHLTYGPYFALPPGHYEAAFALNIAEMPADGTSPDPPIFLDVVTDSGNRRLAGIPVVPSRPGPLTIALPIEVPAPHGTEAAALPLELRVWSSGALGFSVASIHVKRIAPCNPGSEPRPPI